MQFIISGLFLTIFFANLVRAAEPSSEVVLPAIQLTGGVSDVLLEDPIRPAQKRKFSGGSGTGSNVREIQNHSVLPVTDLGKTGGLSQVRGFGRSADDTNVQMMGVPLNLPQGGGFDFSAFPSYLWSGYRFQSGPSAGGFDPRTNAGTLSLQPWTVNALSESPQPWTLRSRISNSQLRQFSVGYSKPERAAILGGYSEGRVKGPSGGFSTSLWKSSSDELRFHGLATSIEAFPTGTRSFSTPQARQKNSRGISLLEWTSDWSPTVETRATVFYDEGILRYDNPSVGEHTFTRSRQTGVQFALLYQDWKLGLESSRVTYKALDFEAPAQSSLQSSVSKKIRGSSWLLEPSFRMVSVSGLGTYPAGSLGFRYELSESSAVYQRFSYTRKFPTLNDLYYTSTSYFRGNRNLKPEEDVTAILGFEFQKNNWSGLAEVYHQRRGQVMLMQNGATPPFIENQGSAWINTARAQVSWQFAPDWKISTESLLSYSKVIRTGTEFPYLPRWTQSAALGFRPTDSFSIDLSGRSLSPSWVGFGERKIAGYAFLDLSISYECLNGIKLTGTVDNLFDRTYETAYDYFSEGRVLALSLEGRF